MATRTLAMVRARARAHRADPQYPALRDLLRSPLSYAERTMGRRWTSPPHLQLLDRVLGPALARGGARFIIGAPPRHAKSSFISRVIPAWFLTRWPHKRVMHTAYEANFAQRIGSRFVRDLLIRMSPATGVGVLGGSSAPQSDWQTTFLGALTDEGGMLSVGMGGALTGRGGDLLLIDDPIKKAAEAMSPTVRANHVDWWLSTASTRLEPGASVVLVMHRWHEADLAGHMLTEELDEGWVYINLTAIAEAGDVLGRAIGAPLWPERYDLAKLEKIRARLGLYWWSALYMGVPKVGDGAVFRSPDFHEAEIHGSYVHLYKRVGGVIALESVKIRPLAQLRFVVAADTALREREQNDLSVFVALALTVEGDIIVWDIHRAHMAVPDQWPALKRFIDRHKPISAGVEMKASGPGIVTQAGRDGIRLLPIPAEVDKVQRAMPVAQAYADGKVYHLQGTEWLRIFERELTGFPLATHDDQVDALAHAFNLATGAIVGPAMPPDRKDLPQPQSLAPSIGLAPPLPGSGLLRAARVESEDDPEDPEDRREGGRLWIG